MSHLPLAVLHPLYALQPGNACAAQLLLQVPCLVGGSNISLLVSHQASCSNQLMPSNKRNITCSSSSRMHSGSTGGSSCSIGWHHRSSSSSLLHISDTNACVSPACSRSRRQHMLQQQQQQQQQGIIARGTTSGSAADDGGSSNSGSGLLGVLQKWNQDTRKLREQLQSLGLAGVVAYGLFNTLYYTVAFLVVWFTVANVPAGVIVLNLARY
jgi:hypothetical protein